MFIYKPIRQYMSPQNITINPSEENTFSLIIDGKQCAAYRFSIYDFANNRKVPPSGDRVSLSPILYNGDTLEITVDENVLTAGESYKWMVELYANDLAVTNVATSTGTLTIANHNLNTGDMVYIQSTGSLPTGYTSFTQYYIRKYTANTLGLYPTYEGAKSDTDGNDAIKPSTVGSGTITISNVAISEQCPFYTYSTPTLTLNPTTITAQEYEFVPTYTHAQNIFVNSFVADLYNEDDVLINSSGTVYSSNIKYSFDGLLSGTKVKIKFSAINTMGQECTTGLVEYTVNYVQPTINIKPITYNNYSNGFISINWEAILSTFGTSVGTFQYMSGGGIHLDNGSYVTFSELLIQLENTETVLWKPDNINFVGDIFEIFDSETNDYVKFGYSGTKFYRNQNGNIYPNYCQSLTNNSSYLLGMTSIGLVAVEVTD